MKLKHLESELSKIRHVFDQPRIDYEQYSTPPHLAASVALMAYDDLTDSVVLDLGCGKMEIEAKLYITFRYTLRERVLQYLFFLVIVLT